MSHPKDIVLFLNDWPVRPQGANSGGGEVATVALAQAFRELGYQVHVCGHLPDGEGEIDGVKYIDFGHQYRIKEAVSKLSHLESFYCFAATLVHPFLFLVDDPRCKARIVINHSPGVVPSGLEPATSLEVADYMACVSNAQRQHSLSRGGVTEERIVVIKNGFQSEKFPYRGPQQRNWRRLLYTGRLEPAKGIHILLESYANLLQEFPNLELRVFGDQSYWPDLAEQTADLSRLYPRLQFFGKVAQARIAEELQQAGILVFPSISFESAPLAVIDAQASGCPVVASAVGGVPEYLVADKCGLLVPQLTAQKLTMTLRSLLRDPQRLIEMSNNCKSFGRIHSWRQVASELLELAAKAARQHHIAEASPFPTLPLARTSNPTEHPYTTLLADHDVIASGSIISDQEIELEIQRHPNMPSVYLWKGLRQEQFGDYPGATQLFMHSLQLSNNQDWQAMFRLILAQTENNQISTAAGHARTLLAQHPEFPMRSLLEKLVFLGDTNNTSRPGIIS